MEAGKKEEVRLGSEVRNEEESEVGSEIEVRQE